MVTEHKT